MKGVLARSIGVIFLLVFLVAFLALADGAFSLVLTAEPPPPDGQPEELSRQVQEAILRAIAASVAYVPEEAKQNLRVDALQFSTDFRWASAWVLHTDPNSGLVLPAEPGLILARWDGLAWRIALPRDPAWDAAVSDCPHDLLSADEKAMWLALNQGQELPYPTQSGYLLPWAGGQYANLSRSVAHDADYTTAHFAFDFYVPGPTICPGGGASGSLSGLTGYNFSVHAAKTGTVWSFEDGFPDCDHDHVNFIVLQNVENPNIYQLYLHLAQNSIPEAFKTIGAYVARGDYIARADNTGASSGSHLHFQIEGQPYWPVGNPYWAASIDVTFDDVTINGGRPRAQGVDEPYCLPSDVCDTFQPVTVPYLSDNYPMGDRFSPTGDFVGVSTGDVIRSHSLALSGWAADQGSGMSYGVLIANFDGAWHEIGEHFTDTFALDWDLCDPANTIPDGPVSVALRLYDLAGNVTPLAGLRHFVKDAACVTPPAACLPSTDQVTLFENAGYGGDCQVFGVGDYASLPDYGKDEPDSLLVGSGVVATLYSESSFGGHSQAFLENSPYLEGELIGGDKARSLRVAARTASLAAPSPVSPVGDTLIVGDRVAFSWISGGGATEYQVRLTTPLTPVVTLTWQSKPYALITLPAEGAYTWQVRGRSATAGESPWSAVASLTALAPPALPAPISLPYSDNMEDSHSTWTASGLWTWVNDANRSRSDTHAWWYVDSGGDYDNGNPNYGYLTSSPLTVSSPGYYLRFWYQYETEGHARHWDQRWVQVSVDGGPFRDLWQGGNDPFYYEMTAPNDWLQSPAIDLSAYVGHTIRLRFAFYTLDGSRNAYDGWGIDDLTINTTPPAVCSDLRQDDTPEQAVLLTYGTTYTASAEICPNGDYDYYRFIGSAGDRVVIDVAAMSDGSPLDSYVTLFDSDGVTALAENDDEVYAQLRDPLLAYTLPHDGIYYLQVRAWKHPSVGGATYDYRLRLYPDASVPTAAFNLPANGVFLRQGLALVTVNASDLPDDALAVAFYWHGANWQSAAWTLLSTDRDGSNGWQYTYNPSSEPEGVGSAIWVKVYDQAGNTVHEVAWNLGIDRTDPTTTMEPLSPTQPSNAFLLGWTAEDNLSGLDYYDLQVTLDGGASWSDYPAPLPGETFEHVYLGMPGKTYGFRLRGVDLAANEEAFPAGVEVATSVPTTEVLCADLDAYDTGGNDNSPENGTPTFLGDPPQRHHFCNPLEIDFENDEDWLTFTAQAGIAYLVRATPLFSVSAPSLALYAYDGITLTLLTEQDPLGFGRVNALRWIADRGGIIYLRVRHVDGTVIGSGTAYEIIIRQAYTNYLPLTYKSPE